MSRYLLLAAILPLMAGSTVPVSSVTAKSASLENYRILAEKGEVGAQGVMAERALESGDTGNAFKWFSAAAEQGDAQAQLRLGDLYVDGRGVIRDSAKAAHWYALAVGRSAEAQWKLGALFQEGDGVQKSPEIAAAMYRRAADQGFADAQNSLASLYIAGLGVKQDFNEAMKLFHLAANQNCADAQLNLAGLYYHGIGVQQNLSLARRWALKAQPARPKEAEDLLARIDEAK